MKVTVIGLGYIGLPTAAMLALNGNVVQGYDASPTVRDGLRSDAGYIADQEVRVLTQRAISSGNFLISNRLEAAEAYIICVPTPNAADGRPNLSYVQSASYDVARLLKPDDLVILESTVPPGTTERIVGTAVRERGLSLDDIHLAHCPERVTPGAIVTELRRNSRIIGGRRPEDGEAARSLYASFVESNIYVTDSRTAELVKVIENTFRDVNIALANELALLCEELGVDAREAIRLANKHPRVDILNPGPGVGGHCIPIDPSFLADAHPFLTELIQTARRVNARMPNHVVRRIHELVPIPPYGRKIALLGASYKANVDDSRESPTQKIDELLREQGYETAVFDPVASGFVRTLASSLEDALHDADAVVLIVDHDVFSTIKPEVAGEYMRGRILVDARGFFDASTWQAGGFQVYTLGSPRVMGTLATHA
ncbi:MAG: nucleotide sugar dehydrogenase [Candidatus Eremiobacteraeota bacterium]|nr:nucleotide sugar dehydrogenase [Candidatus Eremiobacteraeota bacterium]